MLVEEWICSINISTIRNSSLHCCTTFCCRFSHNQRNRIELKSRTQKKTLHGSFCDFLLFPPEMFSPLLLCIPPNCFIQHLAKVLILFNVKTENPTLHLLYDISRILYCARFCFLPACLRPFSLPLAPLECYLIEGKIKTKWKSYTHACGFMLEKSLIRIEFGNKIKAWLF